MTTRNTLRLCMVICMLILSGCVRQPRKKTVEMPARLRFDKTQFGLDSGLGSSVENEQVKSTHKSMKSGMAYKPATFLFGHSASLVAQHQEFEDIPLPLGVTDVQYEIRQDQASQAASQDSLSGESDWCVANWCGQGRCAGDSAVRYTAWQSVEQLTNFYVCNMERLGWQLVADFYTHETILFFDRHDKRCAISLCPDRLSQNKLSQNKLRADKKGGRSKSATKAGVSKNKTRKNSTSVTIFVSLRTALL